MLCGSRIAAVLRELRMQVPPVEHPNETSRVLTTRYEIDAA
jgi:hypothetical protein